MQHDQQGQDAREWAPLAEVAVAMGVSIDTIRRRMKRGEIETRREQTPQGFRWLAPLPDAVERSKRDTAPDARESPRIDDSTAHALDIIVQRQQDELIDTLRAELAIRNREISRLHEVIAGQASALQSLAPQLAAHSSPAPAAIDPAGAPPASAWQRLRRRLAGPQ